MNQEECGIPLLQLTGNPNSPTRRLATETIKASLYPDAMKWLSSKWIYQELELNNDLIDSDLQDFYTQSSTGKIGAYQNVNDEIRDLFSLNDFTPIPI